MSVGSPMKHIHITHIAIVDSYQFKSRQSRSPLTQQYHVTNIECAAKHELIQYSWRCLQIPYLVLGVCQQSGITCWCQHGVFGDEGCALIIIATHKIHLCQLFLFQNKFICRIDLKFLQKNDFDEACKHSLNRIYKMYLSFGYVWPFILLWF